jgi:hypothetical protein
MNWSVDWLHPAEQDLATLWTDASDRAAVTAAANAIDAALARDPLHVGEAREGNRRILFVEPLAVSYHVILDDRRVIVHAVWRWPE